MGVESGFNFVALPSWVQQTEWQDVKSATSRNGIRIILSDTQVNSCEEKYQYYYGQVEQALSTQATETIGHFSIDFNPEFQEVHMHVFNLWRDGKIIWQAQKESFDLIRRERDLEKRILDGRISATLIVPAMKANDIIEYSYTLVGQHPIVGNIIDVKHILNWAYSAGKQKLRVLSPISTKLKCNHMNGMPKGNEEIKGDIRINTWENHDTKPEIIESAMPPGHGNTPYLTVTEDLSWSQISDVFRAAYEEEQDLPQSFVAEIEQLQSQISDHKELTLALLRLVQRDIRYLAISIGQGGLIPRSLEDVWRTRYGDCKDKSLILSRALKHVGIDACPALVNTFLCENLDIDPPRIYAFNHCIVRVKIGDEIRYMDPTFAEQAGNWDKITIPYYEKALPLMANSQIEKIERRDIPHIVEASEEWTLKYGAKPIAEAQIKTYWRDYMADSARTRLYQDGLEVLAKDYADYYDRQYRGAKRLEDTIINDNKEANELEIIEHYQFDNAFDIETSGNTRRFLWRPEDNLPDFVVTQTGERFHPIDLGQGRRKSRKAIFHLPAPHNASWQIDKVEGQNWTAEYEWKTINDKSLSVSADFTCLGGQISAENAQDFFDKKQKADSLAGFMYNLPKEPSLLGKMFGNENTFRIIYFLIFLFFIVFGLNGFR